MAQKPMNEYARYWLDAGMTWADQFWDEDAGLLKTKAKGHSDTKFEADYVHIVRDSVWYATGLLMRGDNERAYKIIESIIRYQFDEPEAVYHGTFKRSPQEPDPPPNASEWRNYDPNWREFICTVFIIIMLEFDVPQALQDKMWDSIQKAATGSFTRKVNAEYTNIALMSAFLLDYAGDKLNVPEWRTFADSYAHEIYDLFRQNNTFWEYNSPTYYGVDLYALALWRVYGLTDTFRTLGAEMEADFWRDIARFYHADLRNLCGPYDRSYGMDMTYYVAVVGIWIALVVPPQQAPLPEPTQPFAHPHDFLFVPPVVLLGAQIPNDVLPHLSAFQGERQVTRTVEADRVATAWLSDSLMLGAETAHPSRLPDTQFHVATAHWHRPDGGIGWLRVMSNEPLSAQASDHKLTVSCAAPRDIQVLLNVGDAPQDIINGTQWTLPGVNVTVDAATSMQVSEALGELDQRLLSVAFTVQAGAFTLDFSA